MTRIVAGNWGGRRLATPPGDGTRPTGEKIRAALGNALAASGAVAGARVLDLYAGSGALALELLSRGARSAVLVEKHPGAAGVARRNVAELTAPATVITADATTFATAGDAGEPFDIVVSDPPYLVPWEDVAAQFLALQARGLLTPGADLVVERPSRPGEPEWPDPLIGGRVKKYGDTLLCYGRAP